MTDEEIEALMQSLAEILGSEDEPTPPPPEGES